MKNIIYVLILLISVTSCENYIDIPDSIKGNKLIMNSLFCAGSDTNYVSLKMSDIESLRTVKDAEVSVYRNGELYENGVYSKNGYILTGNYSAGDKLELKAKTKDGLYSVSASGTVPGKSDIVAVDTVYTVIDRYFNTTSVVEAMAINIKIKDIPDQDNYYRVEVILHDSVIDEQMPDKILKRNVMLISDDPILTSGYNNNSTEVITGVTVSNYMGVFTDKRFRNSQADITVYARPQFQYFQTGGVHYHPVFHVAVYTISRLEYEYLRVMNIIDSDAVDDIVMGPVILPSNVTGGTGLVTFSNSSVHVIDTPLKELIYTDDDGWIWVNKH